MPGFGVERPRELGFQGVYRVPPDGGDLQLVVDARSVRAAERPLPYLPIEKLLYVNDSAKKLIRVFNVAPDGSLSGGPVRKRNPVVVTERRSGRDEMRRARQCLGHGPGGVWVYAPSGELIGKLHIPEVVANLAGAAPNCAPCS